MILARETVAAAAGGVGMRVAVVVVSAITPGSCSVGPIKTWSERFESAGVAMPQSRLSGAARGGARAGDK